MAEQEKQIDAITITPQHEQLVRYLFLSRWKIIEPEHYDRLWLPYEDRVESEMIFGVHKFNLQEQKRFPSDREIYKLADQILQEPDAQIRDQIMRTFINQPDQKAQPQTRTNNKRKLRREPASPDSIAS